MSKKIDPLKFQSAEPQRFSQWENIFLQTGAVSFTQQKLFLINDIRRRYKAEKKEEVIENKPNLDKQVTTPEPSSKPMGFKPKFK